MRKNQKKFKSITYTTKLTKCEYELDFVLKVYLLDRHDKIGYVLLRYVGKSKTGKRIYETHSSLMQRFRKAGIGTWMYARAIYEMKKRGHLVCSSISPSVNAKRMWKSKTMKFYFTIKKKVPVVNKNVPTLTRFSNKRFYPVYKPKKKNEKRTHRIS